MRTRWTKETALAELRALAEESKRLARSQAHSEEHTRWGIRTLTVLEEVFGQNSRYYLSFAQLQWHESGSFIFGGPADPDVWNPQKAIEKRHHGAYLKDLDTA